MSTASHFNIKSNRALHTAGGLLFAFSGLFVVSFLHTFTVNNSYADDNSVDASANVASNLSISANSVSMDTTPDVNGSWLTGTSTVDVSTNNVTGYTLYISSSTDELDLVNTSNSSYVIDNLESETTLSTFQSSSALMNHYGFTHDNNGDSTTIDTDAGEIATGTYLPLATITNPTKIKTTTSAANTSETVVTFATKVDRSIPAGEYTNTITFTAVGNAAPQDLPSVIYMQDFTRAECAALPTWSNGADDVELVDKRDGSTYIIRKLADGNCWMAQNLRLVGKTISPSDSNVSSDFTVPASSTDTGTTNGTWGTSDDAGGIDHAAVYYDDNTVYGAYYNWYTATAGTGTYSKTGGSVEQSICPKSGSGNNMANSWHLPTCTGGADGEWHKMLITSYGYKSGGSGSPNPTDWTTTPINFPFSGNIDGGSLGDTGQDGVFWSSTASGNTHGSSVYVDSSGYLFSAYGLNKRYGFSVRCMLTAAGN